MVPTMVLVADGTRDARRRDALHGLAEAVSDRREVPVCTAFGTRAELRDIVQSGRTARSRPGVPRGQRYREH